MTGSKRKGPPEQEGAMSTRNAGTATRVERPEAFHAAYVEAFNSGGVEPLLDLYEETGTLLDPTGQPVSGHAAIESALRQYQAVGEMTAETRWCIEAGDVALASASWQISGKDPRGEPVVVEGRSADLLRLQEDGRWLLVVDHPFGGQ
jgi:ketosteroid isomerase-like protein